MPARGTLAWYRLACGLPRALPARATQAIEPADAAGQLPQQRLRCFQQVDAGVAMIWVFPLLCGIYGVAKMVLTRRYL